ncbi:hypothetical protein [Hyalangium versicolor]|uniref:hypothetical protein n=1 Tax=Hyalangium versicolor TaxID=2861190 RepID=UPI001CCAFEBB|nr:hypothetical protein [Hyalangium versicolor]
MTYINMSPQFMNAINRLIYEASKNPVEVGVLMRWNENDQFMWTLWSEAFHPGIVTQYSAHTATRQIGGHTEEILIRNWQGYVHEAGFTPRIVDIILTKLPCLTRSAPFTLGTHQLPSGCTFKLKEFIENIATAVLDWRIAYFRGPNPGPAMDIESGGAMAVLSGVPKLSIYHFMDHHSFVGGSTPDGLMIA